jgi:ABC1 atypical kinase-like domain
MVRVYIHVNSRLVCVWILFLGQLSHTALFASVWSVSLSLAVYFTQHSQAFSMPTREYIYYIENSPCWRRETTNSQHCAISCLLSLSHTHKQQTDRHAGNLLACPDGRLCYLDFGMMSYADTNQRNGFLLAVVVRLYLDTSVSPSLCLCRHASGFLHLILSWH